MRNKFTYSSNTRSGGSTGGVSALTVVQIVFIILKCIGTIDWPWRLVLIPTWISLSLAAFIGLLWLLVIAFHAWRKK